MKNILLSLSALLLMTGNTRAQITLTAAGYTTSPIHTDTIKVTTATSAFPSFAPATNATWDLTSITDSSAVLFNYRIPASAPATYSDTSTTTFGGYPYQGQTQMAITSSGLVEYGVNIIGSTNPTGTPGDTLFIATQNDTFSSVRTLIKFPATMSSSWSSSYVLNFKFFVSYILPTPLPPFVHAPAMVKEFATEKDTVIGWGKMRIPTLSGAPSGYVNVLQVRHMRTSIDSFYLNGSATDPALPALLTLFGATQGSVSKSYSQNFYRMDNVTPLAGVKFSDSANTAPTKVTTNVQSLPPNAVENVMNDAGIHVYPNPVTGNTVSIVLPSSTGSWSYELIDISGRKLSTGSLAPGGSQAQVMLPSPLTAGIYYLKISKDGGLVTTTPLNIQ